MKASIYKVTPNGLPNRYDVYVKGKYQFSGSYYECKRFIEDDEQVRQISQPQNADPLLVWVTWILIGVVGALIWLMI